MANTFTILAQTNLTSQTASITFSSISQSYDTLYLYCSAKTTWTGTADDVLISYNSNNSNYWFTRISSASGVGFGSSSTRNVLRVAGNQVANAFGSGEIILGQYTRSQNKRFGLQSAAAGTTSASQLLGSGSWNNTAAITSITLTPEMGEFMSGSNFYLYGVNTTV